PQTKKPVDCKAGRERRGYHLDRTQAADPADQRAEGRAKDRRTEAAYDDERRNEQSRHKTGNPVVVHGKPWNIALRGGSSAGPCPPTNESVSHDTDRNGGTDDRNQAQHADPSAGDRDGSRTAKRKHHRSHESPHVVGK